MKLAVNKLGLIGAIIGIISIFTPWVEYYSMPGPPTWGDNLLALSSHNLFELWFPAVVFMISSLFALISTLSFIGQASGIILFINSFYAVNSSGFEDTMHFTFGLIIGIVSMSLLLLGIVYPFWKRNRTDGIRILDRIMTFTPEKST